MFASHIPLVCLLALLAACCPGATAAEADRPISVYIMTDMEGVAGVLDFEQWTSPESRYYDLGKEFLTLEVNAAIEGFARGGATEFLVADGHGHGAINPKLLDPRRSWPVTGPRRPIRSAWNAG